MPAAPRIQGRDIARGILTRMDIGSATKLVGICGPQGSGKTTLARNLKTFFEDEGIRTCVLSLDDFYLGREQRLKIAREIHPLLATRGPPGTHDLELIEEVVSNLINQRPARIPHFSKALDDRLAMTEWSNLAGPFDLVLLEGWCVGAACEQPEALVTPINSLEAQEDSDGRWRGYVNAALSGYRALFAALDFLVMLRAPSFEVVAGWRMQQEHDLARRHSKEEPPGLMADVAISRFVQHFERLTRHIHEEMPGRADLLIKLDGGREIQALDWRQRQRIPTECDAPAISRAGMP